MVRFLIAEGDGVDFVPIFQDDQKRIDTHIGTADIRYFQVGGDSGASEAELDLRLLDLTVEAEDLPGLIATARRAAPAWMLKAKGTDGHPTAAAPSHWPMIVGSVGALAGLLVVGAGAWLLPAPPCGPAQESRAEAERRDHRVCLSRVWHKTSCQGGVGREETPLPQLQSRRPSARSRCHRSGAIVVRRFLVEIARRRYWQLLGVRGRRRDR